MPQHRISRVVSASPWRPPVDSEHLRQVRADQIAAVVYPSVPLRAVAVELLAPHHQVSFAAVLFDELGDAVAALAVALGALDTQHVELALNIAEDEVTAGHGGDVNSKLPTRGFRINHASAQRGRDAT